MDGSGIFEEELFDMVSSQIAKIALRPRTARAPVDSHHWNPSRFMERSFRCSLPLMAMCEVPGSTQLSGSKAMWQRAQLPGFVQCPIIRVARNSALLVQLLKKRRIGVEL